MASSSLSGAPAELLANPLHSLRKVLRDEPLPECFGTLSVKRWEKIGPVEPYEAALKKTARVALAQNEFESVQIVTKAVGGEIDGVRVEVGELRAESTGAVFPASDIFVWQIGYVEMFSLWDASLNLGWWPDPLLPQEERAPVSVEDGRNQSFLVQFRTHQDTPAGLYRGTITVKATGQPDITLPLEVMVWDFALPVQQHFTMAIPIWGEFMERMWPDSQTSERRRSYLDMLYDYRIAPFPLEGESEIEHALDRGVSDICLTAFPKDRVAEDLVEKVEEQAKLWEKKGWSEKGRSYVLLGDEPLPEQWPIIEEQGRKVREVAPLTRRMNTVCLYAKVPGRQTLFSRDEFQGVYDEYYAQTYDRLKDAVDVFILGAGYAYPVTEATRLAQERKVDLWYYYVADLMYIPMSGTYTRITPWRHWKSGIPGLLHWGMAYFGEANVAGVDGKKWPEIPWNTRPASPGDLRGENVVGSRGGDGSLVYPAPNGSAFWPSLRLANLRDGAEDYEYLWVLNDLTARLERLATPMATDRIAENRRLLALEPGVVNSYTDFTEDGNSLLSARARVAGAIVETRLLLADQPKSSQ